MVHVERSSFHCAQAWCGTRRETSGPLRRLDDARVFAVHRGTQAEELLDILREEGYTRIPVYDRNLDDIVGILHAKDIFHIAADRQLVILKDVLRPVLEISPDLPVVDALRRFRSGRKHLALVREKDGPLLGVCTLEDVLEEIVGEIEDEHDVPTRAGVE